MSYLYRVCLIFNVFLAIHLSVGRHVSRDDFDLDKYHSYEEIRNYLKHLGRTHDHVKTAILRKTYENRYVMLVRVTGAPGSEAVRVLVDAGAHAREWASLATALRLLQRAVDREEGYDQVEWLFIPLVNPDGYEYSRNTNRNWRKNRSKNDDSDCFGTDLNRNYKYQWGVAGVSTDACNEEVYAGKGPLSEQETRAVASVMKKFKSTIKLYVSLHTFGQVIVYPFGYASGTYTDRNEELVHFAKEVAEAIKGESGNKYTIISGGDWYPAAGGSDDFAYASMGIPYSFTLEVTSGYQFEYPEEELPKLHEEMNVAFKKAAELIYDEFGDKSINDDSDDERLLLEISR